MQREVGTWLLPTLELLVSRYVVCHRDGATGWALQPCLTYVCPCEGLSGKRCDAVSVSFGTGHSWMALVRCAVSIRVWCCA